MAAPTSLAQRSIVLANGEPSTHGANAYPVSGPKRQGQLRLPIQRHELYWNFAQNKKTAVWRRSSSVDIPSAIKRSEG
jgi:hypothetical protein